jgi:hypothetical protein
MTRALLFAGLFVLMVSDSPLCTNTFAAGTNDHFANRRRLAAQQQAQTTRRPWGGPTTSQTWWNPNVQRQNRVIVPGGVYFAPGYISPYHGYSPYYQGPRYVAPVYWPRQHIYIEHRLSR